MATRIPRNRGRRGGDHAWSARLVAGPLAAAIASLPGVALAQCAPAAPALRGAPLALVLSGGGAKGAYEAGVALGLRPLDFEPEALGRALERGRADGLACVRGWEGRS